MRLQMVAERGPAPPPITYYPRVVIVGDAGQISYSDDGTTWTNVPSGCSNQLIDVAFSPEINQWITISTAGEIYTSSSGIRWTPRSNPLGATTPVCAAWCGLTSKWVIINNTSPSVLTSPDGITWSATTGAFGGPPRPGNICRGPGGTLLGTPSGTREVPNGAGLGAYTDIMISNDGITWTIWKSTSAFSSWMAAMSYESSLSKVVGVGGWNAGFGGNGAVYAVDGDGAGAPNGINIGSSDSAELRRIVYASAINKWLVAWKNSDDLSVSTSSDPLGSWTLFSASGSYPTRVNEVGYLDKPGAPVLIAAGNSGDGSSQAIKTSPDGSVWTIRVVPGFDGSMGRQIRGIASGRFTIGTFPIPLDTFEDGTLTRWPVRSANFSNAPALATSDVALSRELRWAYVSSPAEAWAWLTAPPSYFVHQRGDAIRVKLFTGGTTYGGIGINATYNSASTGKTIVDGYVVQTGPAFMTLYSVSAGVWTNVGSISPTNSNEFTVRIRANPPTATVDPNVLKVEKLDAAGNVLNQLSYTLPAGDGFIGGNVGVFGQISGKVSGDWSYNDIYLDSRV